MICHYVNIYFNLPLTSISVFIQCRTRTADLTKRKQQLNTTMKSNNGYAVSKCRALFFLIAFAGSIVAVRFLVYYLADRPFPAASYVSSSSADSTTGKTTAKVSDKNIRLPGTALPRHYYVRLFHVLEKCNFTIPGPVSIYLVKAKRRRTESCCTARTSVVEPKSVSVQ